MITFERFGFAYPGGPEVLADVQIRIDPGAFALVTGRTGSGKSTLLRAINGLVPQFSGGRVRGGVRVFGADPVGRGSEMMSALVGMVFQNPDAQFVTGRVEDELAFGLEQRGVPRAEMRARVGDVMARLNLTALRARDVSSLSGGERQRVAIATALVLRPRVLVLDEPTSQLDPESAADVLAAIAALNREDGLTVVISEHRLERVLPLANLLLHVRHGRVLCGAPDTVRAAVPELAGRDPPALPPASRAEAAPRIAVEALRAAHAGREVLAVDALQVKTGECVAVLGRNGSGKTTLLRSLVGLHRPSAARRLEVNGLAVQAHDTARLSRAVACLPQEPDDLLYAETVRDEVVVTLGNHGRASRDAVARVLAQFGLLAHADRHPRDLSAGERLRVALAAVAAHEPPVWLLDEPTRGLDADARRALIALLHAHSALGAAIVVVTHDAGFAQQFAHRAVVLEAGRIVATGVTRDVLPALSGPMRA